ncbi:hypothetical protein [Sphingomonas sp. ID0503]|uniref:hypothetical protein n=1 Tax=Sphingomonas sp. ID0503 TaxID=3399691 RepID=UPI003AFAD20B
MVAIAKQSFGLLCALLVAGEARSAPYKPLPGEPPRTAVDHDPPGRTGLPYARDRSFATLDEYLAFREKQGAIDLPWYREVSPGVYELQTRRLPPPEKTRFTRAELAAKFGFKE